MERASKHIADKKIRKSPHSGEFIVSSKSAMNLKKSIKLWSEIILVSSETKRPFEIKYAVI